MLQIFNRYEHFGGEESSVYRIADALQEHFGVEYFLSSTADLLGDTFLTRATAPYRAFRNGAIAKSLKRYQDVGRFDLWQIHNVFPGMSPVVYEKAFSWGIPVVHYLHNYRLGCTNGFLLNHGQPCERCIRGNFWPALVEKCWHESHVISGVMGGILAYTRRLKLLEKVNAWIAISHCQKQKHVEMGIPAENIHVVHHFYEPAGPPLPPAPNGHALFIGRLSPEKGVMQLLKAWKLLGRKDKNLVIVGEGPELSVLQKYAASEGLTNVRFTGFLNPAQQKEIWAQTAFSIIPSMWLEPFGMVILEAWAKGRPVIGHRIGALPELISVNRNGFLADPEKPESLAAAIGEAFEDPRRLIEMGANGHQDLIQKFNRTLWLEKMLSIYHPLLKT